MSSTASISLNHFTRTSLAAVGLVALFGLTACASGENSSPSADGGSSSQSDSSNKDKGFIEHLTDGAVGFPLSWKDGSGWFTETGFTPRHVVTVGNYMGYIGGIQWASDTGKKETRGILKPGNLIVVDGAGNRVYASKKHDEFESRSSTVERLSKDGKGYLVYIEEGPSKGDPTSAKSTNNEVMTAITIIDENGKEVVSTILADHAKASIGNDSGTTQVAARDDSIRINLPYQSDSLVMDVATGETSPLPAMPDAKWTGRFDGVDIFAKPKVGLTNGTWTTPVVADDVDRFGSLVQVIHNPNGHVANDEEACYILDPHTGKVNTSLGFKEGECISPSAVSPNGNFVSTDNNTVIDISKNKVIKVGNEFDVSIRSITNGGDAYGETGAEDKIVYFSLTKGSEPKVDPGATAYPFVVSDSGLGAFSSGINEGYGIGTYFVLKK